MIINQPSILYSLQIGRAIAAMAVVCRHSAMWSQSFFGGMPDFMFKILDLGYLGVDYFFVLSGFIIMHSTRELEPNTAGAKKYFLSRCIRIYPPYLPISIAMMAALIFLPSLSMGNRENFSFIGSLLLLPSDARPALPDAWTLQHEIVFYFLFGLCFFWLKNIWLTFLWSMPIVMLAFFTLPRWLEIPFGIINLEFLFGIAACILYHDRRLFAFRYALLFLGIAIVLLCGLLLFYGGSPATFRVIAGFGFACIVLGAVFIERHVDCSKMRLLFVFGAASYAIYLTNGPLISVLSRLIAPFVNWQTGFAALITVCLVVGVLYYFLIEKPLIKICKKYCLTPPAP